MAMIYPVLNEAGGVVLPAANGTFYTDDMSGDYEDCHVYVEFFSDEYGEIPAAATAGTITAYGSPMGNIFLLPMNLALMYATEISAGTYTPARMLGAVEKGKIVFNGITGAAYARINYWRAA